MAELKVVEGSKKDPILSSETTDMALFVRTSAEEMDSLGSGAHRGGPDPGDPA